jgi:ubiquinone/menaquinone biosynthesis C-methylase UbiE
VSFFVPPRCFDPDDPEMMDRPGNDPGLLAEDLEILRSINRRFGGLRAVRRGIRSMLDGIDRGKTIEILDLATGSADYPVHVAEWMRRLGRKVRIEAVDNNPFMVAVAHERTSAWPEITVRGMDILSPSYPDGSFDIVLCSSALHHFSHQDAVRILREMRRLGRLGFIVNDLERSRFGAWAAWLYGHLSTTNPITRHDAYASMLRGFTKREMIQMSGEAEVGSFAVKRAPFFRLVLVRVHR